MDTVFKGEHLLPGQIGQFFIVLSLSEPPFYHLSATILPLPKPRLSPQVFGKTWAGIGYFVNTASIMG
jgi:cytochrome c-type biogenesis protein CcmF